jgi:membrane-associated phospholipid phosphatase
MCWRGVDPRTELRFAFGVWGTLMAAGLAATLWLGDAPAVQALQGQAWVRDNEHVLAMFSDWGLYPFYGLFAVAFWAGWRRPDHRLRVLSLGYLYAQVIGAIVGVRLLKVLAGRPRPYAAFGGGAGTDWIGPTWQAAFHSFPSGHAADVMTGAIFATLLWGRSRCWAWWLLAVMVAASRVALARHYPTDVLAGTLLAGAASFAVLKVWVIPKLSAGGAVSRLREGDPS